jgi:V/A-type H+-transporting ATPase subunit C
LSVLAPSPDFVYGNTRLRARKAGLLTAAAYDGLLGRPVDGLQQALAETAYRPELEAALARGGGKRAVEIAIRDHLGRALGEMRSFYRDRARELVDVLLARFDLQNLLTLLRGQVRHQPAELVLAAVVPLGPLGDGTAEEIARRDEPAAAVELLIAWRLPDPETAAALARAWPRFERTQDLAHLEHELVGAHAERVERELAGAPETLRELIARERDAANTLTVLRLRTALQLDELTALPPAPESGRFLPGGRIGEATLDEALHMPARPDAVARLAAASRRQDWQAPLTRYASTDDVDANDLPLLQRELEAARVRWALRLFLAGDPLGIDVPIAYTVAKENEARNLRLIAEGADAEEPAETVGARLLVRGGGGRWVA